MAIEKFIKVQRKNSEVHDFMLGLESPHRNLNLEPLNQDLQDLDMMLPYTTITKPELGTVYMNRAGEKKKFRCNDDAKYYDSTLYLIAKKLDEKQDRAKFRALQKNVFLDSSYHFDRIHEYQNTMRRLESYYGLRKKGD